jgi:hypothetical protein
MTETTHQAAPDTRGRHSGSQDPREDGAAVTELRAASLDNVWCPREGWITTPPPGRHGHPSIRYCPTHPQTAVERHWGPCPQCWVNRVYRLSYDSPAPLCGACQGILRGRGAAVTSIQDHRAAVA